MWLTLLKAEITADYKMMIQKLGIRQMSEFNFLNFWLRMPNEWLIIIIRESCSSLQQFNGEAVSFVWVPGSVKVAA